MTDLHGWITQQIDAAEEYALDHILNPANALRRCEADRRILARHTVEPDHADSPLFATACHGCGTEGDCGDPVTENLNDCPELLDLGYAHGLTGEILAGLDRPQPPKPTPAQQRRLRRLAAGRISLTGLRDVPPALRGPNWKARS